MCDVEQANTKTTRAGRNLDRETSVDEYVAQQEINNLRTRQEYHLRKLMDIQKAIDALKCV